MLNANAGCNRKTLFLIVEPSFAVRQAISGQSETFVITRLNDAGRPSGNADYIARSGGSGVDWQSFARSRLLLADFFPRPPSVVIASRSDDQANESFAARSNGRLVVLEPSERISPRFPNPLSREFELQTTAARGTNHNQ
jgi:hypothetical protein